MLFSTYFTLYLFALVCSINIHFFCYLWLTSHWDCAIERVFVDMKLMKTDYIVKSWYHIYLAHTHFWWLNIIFCINNTNCDHNYYFSISAWIFSTLYDRLSPMLVLCMNYFVRFLNFHLKQLLSKIVPNISPTYNLINLNNIIIWIFWIVK